MTRSSGRSGFIVLMIILAGIIYLNLSKDEQASLATSGAFNNTQQALSDLSALSSDAAAAPRRISSIPSTAGTLMIPFSDLIETAPVNDILIDHEGVVWAATEAGLTSVRNNVPTHMTLANGKFPTFQAQCLAHDGKTLWIGSLFGLFRMSASGRVEAAKDVAGLPSEIINQLEWDGKNLWIATNNGVAFIDSKNNLELIDTRTSNNGLRNNQATRILRFSNWVAITHDLGISLWNTAFNAANPGVWRNIDHVRAGFVRPVRSIAFDGRTLWAATPGGVMKHTTTLDKLFSESSSSFIIFSEIHGLPSNTTRALASHRSGIWVGTDKGLATISQDRIVLIRASNGTSSLNIRTLRTSGDILWIGTNEGLQFINMAGRHHD